MTPWQTWEQVTQTCSQNT